MYCEKCGQQLRDGAKFCNKCGAPVENTKNDDKPKEDHKFNQNDNINKKTIEPANKPRRSKKPLVITLSIVAVAVVLGVVLIVLLTGQNHGKKPSNVFCEIRQTPKTALRTLNQNTNTTVFQCFVAKIGIRLKCSMWKSRTTLIC